MDTPEFSRMKMLMDDSSIEKLKNAHIAIFGIGGVGGYAAEALARCAIENITLVDEDVIDITNLNRQIIALNSTVGRSKVEIMKKRILDINKNAKVYTFKKFFNKDTYHDFDFSSYSYIIDAIDTMCSKILLIEKSVSLNIKIVSSMGTGNKINPSMLEVADIYETSMCPVARILRHELKKRNIRKLKVVYSKEKPIDPLKKEIINGKVIPGSFSFVPSVAGLLLASEVVKDIIGF